MKKPPVKEQLPRIVRLLRRGWPQSRIARHLGYDHSTVNRALADADLSPEGLGLVRLTDLTRDLGLDSGTLARAAKAGRVPGATRWGLMWCVPERVARAMRRPPERRGDYPDWPTTPRAADQVRLSRPALRQWLRAGRLGDIRHRRVAFNNSVGYTHVFHPHDLPRLAAMVGRTGRLERPPGLPWRELADAVGIGRDALGNWFREYDLPHRRSCAGEVFIEPAVLRQWLATTPRHIRNRQRHLAALDAHLGRKEAA